jgi:glycine/D-amino acid oxidase-like deaminating enzyme
METSIIGGGIGGMTLALSLLDAGIDDVDIYESATGFSNLADIVSQQRWRRSPVSTSAPPDSTPRRSTARPRYRR